MEKIELTAKTRNLFGKKVRFLRRQGITPANLYGHSLESKALQIDTADLMHALAQAGMTTLIPLKIDGGKRSRMVIIRDVQLEPVSHDLLHVDLYQVRMEEKLRITVPITVVGKAPAVDEKGGILVENVDSIEVECLPANMPHSIEVDVSGLTEIDQAVHARDLRVPDGVTMLAMPDQVIVLVARAAREEVAPKPVEAAAEEVEVAPAETPVEPAGSEE